MQALIVEEQAIEQPAVGILGPIKTAPTQLTEAQALEQEQIAAEFNAQPIQQAQPIELTPPKPAQLLDIPEEVEEEKIVEEELIEKDIVDDDIVEEEFKQETAKESDLAQDLDIEGLDIEDLEQTSSYIRRVSGTGGTGSSGGGGY